MAEKKTVYLPRIPSRIGVTGYKGSNVRYIDEMPPEPPAVVDAPAAAAKTGKAKTAPASVTKARARAASR